MNPIFFTLVFGVIKKWAADPRDSGMDGLIPSYPQSKPHLFVHLPLLLAAVMSYPTQLWHAWTPSVPPSAPPSVRPSFQWLLTPTSPVLF